ncbi:selenium cofactor biosynthesis protein YqeC [Halovenus halobia]|uniref:selenium cofactor biosynthesis protein YqeC n=1 Tax=Halovenus halobia TaxID=3396622 RepID=UPI003F54FA4E
MRLETALEATDGLVSVVGAGGKKSTLYTLASRLDRAVVTATVRIPIFDEHVRSVRVTQNPVAAVRAAADDDWPLGIVPERERDDRYRGYDLETVAEIAEVDSVGTTLVKADGARMRELKAPNEREPQIPAATDTVLPVASVRAVGEALTDELVHRPELVAELTGRGIGETIRPEDVAATLASPSGGMKDVGNATVVPILNKVDEPDLAATAREIASEVLDRADVTRVALTQMTGDQPLVDVVE